VCGVRPLLWCRGEGVDIGALQVPYPITPKPRQPPPPSFFTARRQMAYWETSRKRSTRELIMFGAISTGAAADFNVVGPRAVASTPGFPPQALKIPPNPPHPPEALHLFTEHTSRISLSTLRSAADQAVALVARNRERATFLVVWTKAT
jgi:hypothetical protein